MTQYTVRNVPKALDRELREYARRHGVSLNEAVLEAIRRGLGIADDGIEYRDLDDLIGTWQPDLAFDQAIEDQDVVDSELWR